MEKRSDFCPWDNQALGWLRARACRLALKPVGNSYRSETAAVKVGARKCGCREDNLGMDLWTIGLFCSWSQCALRRHDVWRANLPRKSQKKVQEKRAGNMNAGKCQWPKQRGWTVHAQDMMTCSYGMGYLHMYPRRDNMYHMRTRTHRHRHRAQDNTKFIYAHAYTYIHTHTCTHTKRCRPDRPCLGRFPGAASRFGVPHT